MRPVEDAAPQLTDELAAQAARVLHGQRWVGPVGTAAAGLTLAWLLRDLVDRTALVVWLLAILAASLLTALGHWLTSVRLAAGRDAGRVLAISHLVIGVVGGLLAFVDLDVLSTDLSVRMALMSYLWAMGVGVTRGTSPLSRLAALVVIPMWSLAIVAYLMAGAIVLAAAHVIAFGLLADARYRDRLVWRELVELRVSAAAEAARRRVEARRDALTGLLNRAGADAFLTERSDAAGERSVIFIDLDRFKPINDEYGHACGDEVLVEIARRLNSVIRDGDVAARIGGDEFLIVAGDDDGDGAGRRRPTGWQVGMATRIVTAIQRPIELAAGDQVSVSASVGIAVGRGRVADLHDLLRRADAAMYRAKQVRHPARPEQKVVLAA